LPRNERADDFRHTIEDEQQTPNQKSLSFAGGGTDLPFSNPTNRRSILIGSSFNYDILSTSVVVSSSSRPSSSLSEPELHHYCESLLPKAATNNESKILLGNS
jgi:hypothetical protein